MYTRSSKPAEFFPINSSVHLQSRGLDHYMFAPLVCLRLELFYTKTRGGVLMTQGQKVDVCFETGSYCVAKAGLELVILFKSGAPVRCLAMPELLFGRDPVSYRNIFGCKAYHAQTWLPGAGSSRLFCWIPFFRGAEKACRLVSRQFPVLSLCRTP